ncbi:MAG: HesA/MoeB/ThiF family protein [Anaerorhabdus sp.]
MLKKRYKKNMNCFSKEELEVLHTKRIAVVGCGGLGGYVIQALSRFGIKSLTIIDKDYFDISNLNRQVFSSEENIGRAKVNVISSELKKINSSLKVISYQCMLDEKNVEHVLCEVDIIIDCVDNIEARKIMASFAKEKKIPLIHGAIAGYYGQISTILPEDKTMEILYPKNQEIETIEKDLGNPSFTPMCIASIQVSECLKCLLGYKDILHNKIMHIDLLRNDFEVIEIKTPK